MKRFLYLVVFVLLLPFIACAKHKGELVHDLLGRYPGRNLIYISKKNFSLEVYSPEGERICSFMIGYGSNPDRKPKLHTGDNRTPEGLYFVTEILSMDSDRSTSSFRRLSEMNRIFFRAKEGHSLYGHPDRDLGNNAYGPRFLRLSYPEKHDIERYEKNLQKKCLPVINGRFPGIGSGIAIHGNADSPSIGHLASSGCVRMFNKDIVQLDRFVRIGTPVFIAAGD